MLGKQMENFMLHFGVLEAKGTHPVLVAAFLHEALARIHPFIDGNGRTSRLLMNLYLLRHGYTIVNLKGDNETRRIYYAALEASYTDPVPFQRLVIEAKISSLKSYLSVLGSEA